MRADRSLRLRMAGFLVSAMTAFHLIAAPAGAAVFVPGPVNPAKPDSAIVAATVARFHDALASGDSAAALDLLASDATIFESGDEESRATYAAHHLHEDIAFARAVRSVRGALKVTVVGNVAWVSSLSTTQGQFNGRAVNSAGAELMILTRSPKGGKDTRAWKIRVIHWSSHRRTS